MGGQTGRRLCSSPFHQVLGVPRFRQNGCPGRSLGSAGKLISVCSEHSSQKMVQGPTGWLWSTGCWHLGLSLPVRPEGGEGGGTPPSPGESAPKASGAGFLSGTDQDANIFLLMMSSVTPAMPTFAR